MTHMFLKLAASALVAASLSLAHFPTLSVEHNSRQTMASLTTIDLSEDATAISLIVDVR